METEEKESLTPAPQAQAPELPVPEPEQPDSPAEESRCEAVPAADGAPEEMPEEAPAEAKPTMEILDDGTRILKIPKGYEPFPDGWYPKNPVRRFMERWGAFLNLGLMLVLVAVIAAAALTYQPMEIYFPEPPAVPEATAPMETIPFPTEVPAAPTMPPIEVPVQSECFTAEDGVLSFDREKWEPSSILVLPEQVDGQDVIAVADGAFEGLAGVTTLILPEGLRTVGARAFADCPDLRGVSLPTTTRIIGSEAFFGCPELESVSMPGSVQELGEDALGGCAALRFIFFAGPHSRWERLCSDYLTPFTFVFCTDGEFAHGAQLPG